MTRNVPQYDFSFPIKQAVVRLLILGVALLLLSACAGGTGGTGWSSKTVAHTYPNGDRYGEPTWHFLRTTGRTAELPNRLWLRDGKYVPMQYSGARLFDLPVDAWVKHPSGDYRNPVIGRFSLRHDLDLRFESGDV